jgi:hypothetical protein
MKFSREISLGTIVNLIVYLITIIWFAAQISAGQDFVNKQIDELKIGVHQLTVRIDSHIDKGK